MMIVIISSIVVGIIAVAVLLGTHINAERARLTAERYSARRRRIDQAVGGLDHAGD